MGSVHPARFGAAHDDDGGCDLLAHYRIAVDEYRFQVNMNWSRAQYLLVFNTAILAAAAAVVRLDTSSSRLLAALLLLVGAGAPLGSLLVTPRHDYHRAARDQVREIARRLRLGEPGHPPALATTAGMRGERGARLKARTVIDGLFVLIAVIDLAAAAYLFT